MRKRILPAALAVALLMSAPMVAVADDPPPPPPPAGQPAGPPVEKSDAEAGCQYGAQPASSFTPMKYDRGYMSAFEWNLDNAPKTECNISLLWVPFARSTVSNTYTFVSSTENNGADANNGMCPLGAADPDCSPKNWQQLLSQSATYRCTSDADLNCVQSIDAVDESGTAFPGTYLRDFPSAPRAPATTGNGAYTVAGGGTPVWSFALPGGNLNVVTNGVIETNWSSQNGQWQPRGGASFRMTLFGVDLIPDERAPKFTPSLREQIYNGVVVKKFDRGGGQYSGCLMAADATCGRNVDLPAGYRFRITMRMPEGALLFLNGRLRDPLAYTEPLPGGYRLVIEAAPAEVLSVAQVFPKAVFTRDAIDGALTKSRRPDGWVFQRSNADNFSEGAGNEALVWLNLAMPLLGDRSSWVSRIWTVSSTSPGPGFGSACDSAAKNSFLGIVSSNATAYTGEPPTYNKQTSTLEYEVSAPHYLPDGKTAATGIYALNLNAKFMMCLLGVSKVPDQASVQLTYGDGEVNTATINVRQTKDWLTLLAANFHFSSPKINVSFAKPATAPVEAPKTAPKTLTCVKGKSVKKFVGKCPAGWKKK